MRKKRRLNPRRRLAMVLVLAIATIAVTAVISAAQSSSSGTRGLNTERPRAHRLPHRQPPLVWVDGVLAQDRIGAWMLSDGTPLRMAPNVIWREEIGAQETVPHPGRTVRLMGQWHGRTFSVRQATLVCPRRAIERMQPKPVQPPDQPIDDLPQ